MYGDQFGDMWIFGLKGLTKWHSHCQPGKIRSRLLSLSGVG